MTRGGKSEIFTETLVYSMVYMTVDKQKRVPVINM